MEAAGPPSRPQHRRNASSKSNLFRALVSPAKVRAGSDESDATYSALTPGSRTTTVPLLPPDHPHVQAEKGKVLGERGHNARSPPSASPSKSRTQRGTAGIGVSKTSHDFTATSASPTKKSRRDEGTTMEPKKSNSSTNLTGMFARMNRSSKDLSALDTKAKDKENTTPPSSSNGPAHNATTTPIWAQYASTARGREGASRPGTRDGIESSVDVNEEIKKYTPREYSPSKQRNFNGTFEQPKIRPTLSTRPQSAIFGTDMSAGVGRRGGGDRTTLGMGGRKSEDLDRRKYNDDRITLEKHTDRKTSGSSAEVPPPKETLNVIKRGSRVMAAVAVFQGKDKSTQQVPAKSEEAVLDEKQVDKAFEAVLVSRNIPEPMRQKMRSLTLRVKADFVKQDQEASKHAGSSPPGTATHDFATSPKKAMDSSPVEGKKVEEEDTKSTKRSRGRSRTFTFSKGDKRSTSSSPTKKQRSHSKPRPISTAATPTKDRSPTTPTTPRASFDKRHSGAPAVPADYIKYLQQHQDVTKLEVGRLHKLRILLRNETVAWVDTFLSLGGMVEITELLHRILGIEWREEHEDQLLHEALLCLKGLCTTERAMAELEKIADRLFKALISVMFDFEAKRGPAEYTTRGVVMTVMCKSKYLRYRQLLEHILTITSHLPRLRDLISNQIRASRPPDPRLPRRTTQTPDRTAPRLRPRHARSTPLQIMGQRSDQRDQRSLLDLPAPPQRHPTSAPQQRQIHRLGDPRCRHPRRR